MPNQLLIPILLGLMISILIAGSFMSSAQPPGNYLDLDDANRIYYEYNHAKKSKDQPTFILSHGLASSMFDLKPLATKLQDYGSVLNWDRLSYGYSFANIPDSLTIQYTYRRTQQLLAGLDIRHPFIYVGYSLGTIHAIHFQRQNPDLVKALILIDPPLQAEKLRERNYYNTYLPSFIESLQQNIFQARFGWSQLKARFRVLAGREDPQREPIYSLKHQQASLIEAQAFPRFLDQVDYSSSFGKLPLLVFSRGRGVDLKIVKDFVSLSQHSAHKIYPSFGHSDFISPEASGLISKDIVDFLESIQ